MQPSLSSKEGCITHDLEKKPAAKTVSAHATHLGLGLTFSSFCASFSTTSMSSLLAASPRFSGAMASSSSCFATVVCCTLVSALRERSGHWRLVSVGMRERYSFSDC